MPRMLPLVVALGLLPALGLPPAVSNGEDRSAVAARVERKIAIEAAKAAIRKRLEAVPKALSPAQIDSLTSAIEADTKNHKTQATSRNLSRRSLEASVGAAFEVDLKEAIRKAGVGVKPIIERKEVVKELGDLDGRLKDATELLLKTHFDAAFRQARERAVTAQATRLTFSAPYPNFDVLDKSLTNPRWEAALDAYRPKLLQLAQQLPAGMTLFEENEQRFGSEADRVLSDVKEQVRRQLNSVDVAQMKNAVPREQIVSEAIYAWGDTRLQQSIAELARERPSQNKPYPPFTMVLQKLKDNAATLERDRFEEFLRGYDISVEDKNLSDSILKSLDVHRDRTSSERAFVMQLLATHGKSAVNGYCLSVPEDDREAARSRFTQLLRTTTTSGVLSDRIAKSVAEKLPRIRTQIAESQVREVFPDLPEFKPTAAVISERFDNPRGERSADFTAADQILSGDASRSKTKRPILLVETESLVAATVEQRIEEGVASLRAQLAALRKVEETRSRQLKREIVEGASKESLVQSWTEDVETLWSDDRHAKPYPQLFQRSRNEIVKSVSQHFDSVRQQLAAELRMAAKSQAAANDDSGSSTSREKAAVQQPIKTEAPNGSFGGNSGIRQGLSAGGSGGGGGGGGGSARGDGQDDGNEKGDGSLQGDGPLPDVLMHYLGTESDCHVRIVRRDPPKAEPSTSADTTIRPDKIDDSARDIVACAWSVIEPVAIEKMATTTDGNERQSSEPAGANDGAARARRLYVHINVDNPAVRAQMNIRVRTALEAKLRDLGRANNQTLSLSWSEGLGGDR